MLAVTALRDLTNSKYVAHISGKADFMTFHGQQISLDSLSGVYDVMTTTAFSIQTYQVSCHVGSCVIAMAVTSSSGDDLVILPSGQDNKPPLIYSNLTKVDITSLTTSINGFTVIQESMNEVKVTVSSTDIYITSSQQWMDITIMSATSDCSASTGILDKCNAVNPNNDYSSKSDSEIDALVNTTFRQTSGALVDTLYTIYQEDVSNGAGFTLLFDNTAAVSEAIHYTTDILDDKAFSLSVYFKPTNQEGVILSYSGNTTFTIYNTNPLTLECGDTTINTSISPANDSWNQLVLTFRNSSSGQQQIHLYQYGTNSSVTYQIIDTSCDGLFQEGGVISLGEWVPSYSSDKRVMSGTYQGYIDEVSVWKDPIAPAMIYQAQNLNVKLSGFIQNVSALYTFAEAVGTTVFDNVFDNNIDIPYSPWQAPLWKVSDLQLATLSTGYKVTTDITNDAVTFCSSFFVDPNLSANCPGQDADRTWWYRKQCEELASSTGNVSYGILPMVTYITTCRATKNVATQPLYQMLCDLNTTIPHWITQKCQNCKFGFWNTTLSACTCYSGYYGMQCDGLCPGGADAPCSNHGNCDTSGTCQCSDHWTGTSCESCSSGWLGDECIYLTTGHTTSSSPLVAQVTTTSQIITFDGVMFVVKNANNYKLFAETNLGLEIHGVFAECIDQGTNHLCLNAIVIQTSGGYYYLKTDSFQTTRVVMYSTTGDTNIYTTATVATMTLQVTSTNVIQVTFTNLDLSLKVTFISNRLMVLMNLGSAVWSGNSANIEGMLTSCDTVTAIKLGSCSAVTRADVCSGTATAVTHASCSMQTTWAAIGVFISNYHSNDSTIDNYLNSASVVTASSCLHFSGTGIYTEDLTFPTGNLCFIYEPVNTLRVLILAQTTFSGNG